MHYSGSPRSVSRFSTPSTTQANELRIATGTGGVPGSANTSGAWVEIFSSTPVAFAGLELSSIHNGVTPRVMLDIGIGPASSEVMIFDSLMVGPANGNWGGQQYRIPLRIPQGSRLCLRVQASAAWAGTMYFDVRGIAAHSGERSFGICKSYMGNRTTTAGDSWTGVNNVLSAWREIVAATEFRVGHIQLSDAASTETPYAGELEIGIGAASSEIGLVSRSVASYLAAPWEFPVNIPAGTRIAYRGAELTAAHHVVAHLYG